VFLAARHDEQKLIKPVEVKPMKLTEGFLFARSQASREQRHGTWGFLRRGIGFHGFGSG
jgi:hypothetical protein